MAATSLNPRHLPALYFAVANSQPLLTSPLLGNAWNMRLYGLPAEVIGAPASRPAWEARQGRTVLLGLLMHVFYWRGQYAACDTLLVGVAFLGLSDFWTLWRQQQGGGPWPFARLIFSAAFAATGWWGWTQS
ncbi:hypothetical protein F4780DRAFT_727969 [Xylariomycetidae sp. FL0641]|nr:hypothetical protein F4780DRAFT_727969 [Xylariomycetidae sp. FL0641]